MRTYHGVTNVRNFKRLPRGYRGRVYPPGDEDYRVQHDDEEHREHRVDLIESLRLHLRADVLSALQQLHHDEDLSDQSSEHHGVRHA